MFELYLHSLLVTYITKEENDKLAQLRGKVLTKDKYNEVGIILKKVSPKINPKYFSKLGDAVNTVELPAPPKILTEWEITKFGIKDSGYNPLEVNPKKLIQFV